MVSVVQISNRLRPSLVASSSRMRRLVSSSSALYTSATHESICKCVLAYQGADATRQHAALSTWRFLSVDWRSGRQAAVRLRSGRRGSRQVKLTEEPAVVLLAEQTSTRAKDPVSFALDFE